MRRSVIANVIGALSVACSLAFWLMLGVTVAFPSLHGPLEGSRVPGLVTILTWPTAFLLAVVATAIGARRWAIAALLAIVSFIAAMGFLAGP